jgi:hypothetical protein
MIITIIKQSKNNVNNESFELTILSDSNKNKYFINYFAPQLDKKIDYELLKNNDPYELTKFFYDNELIDDFKNAYNKLDNKNNKKLNIFLLIKSFDYKNIDDVKNFMSYLPDDELYNIKIPFFEYNIVEFLACHGMSYSCGRQSYFNKKNYPYEDDSVLNIVSMVVKRLPLLINDKAYKIASVYKNHKIIEIFKSNDILDDQLDNQLDNTCMICSSSRQNEELISDICACKTLKIHYRCAQKMIKTIGSMCKTCYSTFKKNDHVVKNSKIDDDIYFPHLGIYPKPAFCDMYIKHNDYYSKLESSILFLKLQNLIN